MKKGCNVYIDEAGDLGFNRGTQWFVLSAVIVNNEDEEDIRRVIQRIRSRLNLQSIHFRTLRNFSQSCYVVNELKNCNFKYANIIVDTNKIDTSKFKHESTGLNPSFIIYNFACRYLLERVSWLLRDTDRVGKVILSSRGTSRDKELITYIEEKLLNYSGNEISNCFTGIISKTADSWDLLQLADVCATTMFKSYEQDRYGFITPCFTRCLKTSLYKRNGKIDKYGIKYFSEDMRPNPQYFDNKIICK